MQVPRFERLACDADDLAALALLRDALAALGVPGPL